MSSVEALLAASEQIGALALSPEGDQLAMLVARPSGARVVIRSLGSGTVVEHEAEGVAALAWHPSGRLLILRTAGGRGRLVALDSGTGAQTELMSVPVDADQLAVSPDGSRVAVREDVAAVGGWPVVLDDVPHVRDGTGIVGDRRATLHVAELSKSRTWTLAASGAEPVRAIWDPAGTALAVVMRHDDLFDQVRVVDAAGGERRRFGPRTGLTGPFTWAPDGRALLLAVDRDRSWHVSDLVLATLDGDERVVHRSEGVLQGLAWTEHGVRAHVCRAGQSELWAIPLGDGEPACLWRGDDQFELFGGGGDQVALGGDGSSPRAPWVVLDRTGTVVASGAFGSDGGGYMTERLAAGGEETVDVFLHRPAKGEARGLVVDLHGGPFGAYGPRPWLTHLALLRARYAVAAPNPRGSTSYGRPYAAAVIGAWGEADLEDVHAVAATAQGSDGLRAVPVAVSGYSYGGYLVGCAVAADDRFACAVAAAPVWDLASALALGEEGRAALALNSLGHDPVPLRARCDRYSPSRRVRRRISTPTLICAGEADWSCPVSQAEMMHYDLRSAGTVARLIRYPGESHHSLSDWGRGPAVRDRLERTIAWLGAHCPS